MTSTAMVTMVRGWITVELNTMASMIYMAWAAVWNPMSVQESITQAVTWGVGVSVIFYNLVNTAKAIRHWDKPTRERKPSGTNILTNILKRKKRS